jgi:hypothetical protein
VNVHKTAITDIKNTYHMAKGSGMKPIIVGDESVTKANFEPWGRHAKEAIIKTAEGVIEYLKTQPDTRVIYEDPEKELAYVIKYVKSVKRISDGLYEYDVIKVDQEQEQLEALTHIDNFFYGPFFKIIEGTLTSGDFFDVKTAMFKRSVKITENLIKYNVRTPGQPELWDELLPEVKSKIEATEGVTIQMINQKGVGIFLNSTEHKLLDCICLLLHEKSQNADPSKTNYYKGNPRPENKVLEIANAETPFLNVTMHEVAKLFNGGVAPGGDVIKTVRNALHSLSNDVDKKALIEIKKRVERKGAGGTLKIRDYTHLIKVRSAELTMDSGESSKETLIALHPIFRDQIEKYFTLLPTDINQRMINAAGSRKISEVTYRLREYLVNQLSFGNLETEIGESKLYWMLNEKYMKNRKGSEVRRQFQESVEIVKKIGLLDNCEVVEGVGGLPKVIFKMHQEWQPATQDIS